MPARRLAPPLKRCRIRFRSIGFPVVPRGCDMQRHLIAAAAFVVMMAASSPATAQYWNYYPHADGGGFVYRYGNQAIVQYNNGFTQQYYRDGNWHYYSDNAGNVGARLYDDYNQVQRFDYRNYGQRTRVIGENPYPTNPYGRRWSYRWWW